MALSDVPTNEPLQIVRNPYRDTASAMRKGVVVKGAWRSSYARFIEDNEIEALYLNSALGFEGDDLGFLRELRSLKELNIILGSAMNLGAIEELVDLEDLSITCSTPSRIDASSLSRLKKVFLHWWPGAESFLHCGSIRSLYLDKFDARHAGKLSRLAALQDLVIGNSAIADVSFIDGLGLRKLELLNCKKIADYSPIKRLACLKWLAIRGCRHVGALDFLPDPSSLEVLLLSDAGEVPSLGPITSQAVLRAFAFEGATSVKDLDLSPLLSLASLSMLMFKPRKGYSHKLIKPWHWSNFDHPDALLAAC